MKKLITLMMSLLIMTTMTGNNIYADDTIGTEGGEATAKVESEDTVNNSCATDEDVFKVTVAWNIVPGTYERTDKYTWNADELKYTLKESNVGTATSTDGTAVITLTNYSNTDVDYKISYKSSQVNSVDITSEAPANANNDKTTGTVASADTAQTIEGEGNTYKQAIYNGIIAHTDAYKATATGDSDMGTYSVKISKHLTLDKTALTIKTGRTYTSLKASTPVAWSSSNENVATVDENGKVTTLADGTANIIATSKVTGMTASCKVTVKSSGAYFLHDSQEDFDLLLATNEADIVSYIDPETSKTVYAYNGFIKETFLANWYNAQSFVKALNDNNIKPIIAEQGTEGNWRLIKSESDVFAWAKATNGTDSRVISDYSTRFGNVCFLWSCTEYDNTKGNYFFCRDGAWRNNMKSYSSASYMYCGFLVTWEPAN